METKKYNILKINKGDSKKEEDEVIVEYRIIIFLDNMEFISLLCTPKSLKNLIVGFLYSEGIINSKNDLEEVCIDEDAGRAYVYTKNKDHYYFTGDKICGKRTVTTDCGRQKSITYSVMDFLGTESDKIKTCLNLNTDEIFDLINQFNRKSELFFATGGVHSCALCDKNGVILFEEDIGRHNAFDKILGNALLNDINLEDKIITTSGRVSSEMVVKVVKSRIPMLVSRSAPTDAAVDMARKYNLTLIGFARGQRMNVYSSFENIY